MILGAPSAKDHEKASRLGKDLKTLIWFVDLYCQGNHADQPRQPVTLRQPDVTAIAGRTIELCPDCTRLLCHALVKRSVCPMDPKPMCKHCPNHCYHPTYREQIREVMRYSGRKIVMQGRLDCLWHLLF